MCGFEHSFDDFIVMRVDALNSDYKKLESDNNIES